MTQKIRPHLIQRCTFKKNVKPSEAVNFSAVAEQDYMGSSEFEFGAKNASLKVITAELDQYQLFETPIKNKDGERLFLFCKPEHEKELQAILQVLKDRRQRTYRLQEPMRLNDCLEETRQERGYNYSDLFWDLENHWLAGFKKDNMKLLIKGITNLRDTWQREGKI